MRGKTDETLLIEFLTAVLSISFSEKVIIFYCKRSIDILGYDAQKAVSMCFARILTEILQYASVEM